MDLDALGSRKPGPRHAAGQPAVADTTEYAFPTIKALAIVETLVTANRPLDVSEICAFQGIPKPTGHRIVRMLEKEGVLQREPGKRRFVPGARLLRLGLGIVSASMQRAPRHAVLESLSKEIGETCNFGVMSGSNVVYLDRVESSWPLGLRFEPGSRVPLHCTAMGKLFLSLFSPRKRTALLRGLSLDRYTDNTITDVARLEEELQRIRESGLSTDNQEFLTGVICVATPVVDLKGQPVAALAISAPLARMTLEQGLGHITRLQAAAARLSETINLDIDDESNEPKKGGEARGS